MVDDPSIASLSARRAWIEITQFMPITTSDVSLSARRAWIEILAIRSCGSLPASLSARRAWIEIVLLVNGDVLSSVALRKESVDRNNTRLANIRACIVALRKESVDRNSKNPMICVNEIRRSPQGERG